MTSPVDGHRRPELGEVLREPTTPAALLEAVRLRMIGARQRENRAPDTTAALIHERLPDLAANHNMHIMQNLGLLMIATDLPELKTAEAWKAQAIGELERAAQVQITDGGG
jgi:hypothetical protein